MPIIRPIKDLRNTIEISELCHSVNEPVFITKNGHEDLVIMSNEVYEKQLALLKIFSMLREAEKQIDEGKCVEGEEALKYFKSKYKYDTPEETDREQAVKIIEQKLKEAEESIKKGECSRGEEALNFIKDTFHYDTLDEADTEQALT